MRPGQNKRMRGRNNNNNNHNRRGPNPLTRSYESNGPDVKIRGTAHHVGEKYLQLARDAQSSGDPVMAESYLQHAEHYFRLIASAQLAQQQAQFGYQRQPGEAIEQDDDNDDDFESLPDRFASPSERVAQSNPGQGFQGQGNQGQPNPGQAQGQQGHGQQSHGQQGQPQPYETRHDRSGGDRNAYDNRNGQDRGNNGYVQNGSYNDRGNQDGRQRQYMDRGDRNGGAERGQPQERHGQQDRHTQQDRSAQQDRNGTEANGQEQRSSGERAHNGGREDRPARDYDNRTFRNRRDDRPRDGTAAAQPRQPVPDEQPSVGLPAFITAPTRIPVADVVPDAPQPVIAQPDEAAPAAGDDASFHMRPRRRRRSKADFAAAEPAGESAPPASSEGGE